MNAQALLIELVTEELPPKALKKLSDAFAQEVTQSLESQHLLTPDNTVQQFAAPRRLAVLCSHVLDQAPEQDFAQKLMPVSVGLDADRNPTPALTKKLGAIGLSNLTPDDLHVESDGKKDFLVAKGKLPGAVLAQQIQSVIEQALSKLPIPKMMRYQLADGETSVKFVRPAHRLVLLHGSDVLDAEVLGIKSSNQSSGHRFMGAKDVVIASATAYEPALEAEGKVIPSFEKRKEMIAQQLQKQADERNADIGTGPEVEDLLEEVTSLVEYPCVYVGEFDEAYLQVPQECLILTMRLNQKYFPLFTKNGGKLTNQFLIVSNMELSDPSNIIKGNERVVEPRLADAKFFYETDKKTPLQDRLTKLSHVVYHNKLGSQLERSDRIAKIAAIIADSLGADTAQAEHAVKIAKNDLTSLMVGEFPELQGVMASYYAKLAGDPDAVVSALARQYAIRYDYPVSKTDVTAVILYVAERIETLTGIWGIGLLPSGERDPFALRRAALGVISAFEALAQSDDYKDQLHTLDLRAVLQFALGTFEQPLNPDTPKEVYDFILERYRNQLADAFARNEIDAVLIQRPPLSEVKARLSAVKEFAALPEAESLVAANKRINNLLKKVDEKLPEIREDLLSEAPERQLFDTMQKLSPESIKAYEGRDYSRALVIMAGVREAVDQFFNDVMVMADDEDLRKNRLALLQKLRDTMNQVADIASI